MRANKQLAKFIRKFHRSVTTHLGKQIIFSTNFKNVKSSISYLKNYAANDTPYMIFVLTPNSKMDLGNASEVLQTLFNLRTFKDLNIQKELSNEGIMITFIIENITYQYTIMIFKSYNISDNVLSGYKTNEGIEFFWVDFIDYQAHPCLVTEEYVNDFHRILQRKIECNIDIKSHINWTEEILKERWILQS